MKQLYKNEQLNKVLSIICASLLVAFLFLITLGSYYKIKKIVIIIYGVISLGLLFVSWKKCVKAFVMSPIMWFWLIYCMAGLLSTVFILKSEDPYIILTEISFTFILIILCQFADYHLFSRVFRLCMLILCILSYYQLITGIPVWRFMKEGTDFQFSISTVSCILSIFEYRHYYGCYLLLAFFSVVFFPEKNKILNSVYVVLFTASIILTYTRSVWLGFFVSAALLLAEMLVQQHRENKLNGSKKEKKNVLLSIIVTGVILVALAAFLWLSGYGKSIIAELSLRIQQAFDIHDGSVWNRLSTFREGIKHAAGYKGLNLLIGSGNGSAMAWLANEESVPFRGAIDNQYVFTLLENGIVGFVALICMIGYSVYLFFARRDNKIVMMAALTFIAIAVAFFFFEVVVVSSSVYALWMFCLCSLADGKIFGRKTK